MEKLGDTHIGVSLDGPWAALWWRKGHYGVTADSVLIERNKVLGAH